MEKESVLILHNLRSAHNVGAIFRTAEAAGVAEIYLTGYTPRPRDRFGRPNREISKVALGAENFIPWESAREFFSIVGKLVERGYRLVALEQSPAAIDYRRLKLPARAAIVLGNETKGLSLPILKQCWRVAEIPMLGRKESLNVAVAAGIALFHWLEC